LFFLTSSWQLWRDFHPVKLAQKCRIFGVNDCFINAMKAWLRKEEKQFGMPVDSFSNQKFFLT